jgi:cell division protein FtsB
MKMNTDREHSKEQTEHSRWGFHGKTVWDWLALLIVPVVLVGFGLWFTAQQNQRQQQMENLRAEAERELAEQRAQDEALQAYLDKMSQLILDRKLLEVEHGHAVHEQGDPVHTLAQARTSTAILRLDAEHNESVTHFLISSGLSVRSKDSARLLRGSTLSHAKLSGAHLPNADLGDADLSGADLSNALLDNADLMAHLPNADLSGASLIGADLSGAVLDNANLSGAEGITNEQLEQQAASLEGAKMPNGQKHEDWLKSKVREEDG